MAKPFTFEARSPSTIRDNGLRTLRVALLRRGVASPNVDPGSDFFAEFQAFGNELAVVEANAVVMADQLLPDTASGDRLAIIGAARGKFKRPGIGAVGSVVADTTAAALVVTGAQLTGPQGFRYKVTVGGTYGDGDLIPIAAIDPGAATILDEGTALTWQTPPAFFAGTALVGPGGTINGSDPEDDEDFRARILANLQNPPAGDNPQALIECAIDSSPAVQAASAYPTVQGPGTQHIAVTAVPTRTNKSRQIAAATMAGTIVPYVLGKLGERAYTIVTTVRDTDATVAFGLSLPAAPTASPPGVGGGWLNGSPWPSVDGVAAFKCAVTAVTSTTVFTVDAATPPTPNVSRIAWLSPFDWKLYAAVVRSYTGTAGAYVITIDTPFVGIAADCLIWPQAEKMQRYADAVLAAFRLMGPGEKTDNASALARGFRHPPVAEAWPASLGPHLVHGLESVSPELAFGIFLYRSDGVTTVTGTAGAVMPQVPADVEDPPRCFVPRHLAFYPVP